MKKIVATLTLFFFIVSQFLWSVTPVWAGTALPMLPPPGELVRLSGAFAPPLLKGIEVFPDDPLKFNFIIDQGDKPLNEQQKQEEYRKLIKYFMAALTIPEENMWVNLSPYEKDRIITDDFAQTEMGRDLLSQDYLLKQITASLMYPEDNLGREFWQKVYAEAYRRYGSTQVPVNTFNKVWIVPKEAYVFEKDSAAYIMDSELEVMLEEDYLARESGLVKREAQTKSLRDTGYDSQDTISRDLIRQILLPGLQTEVNEGKNFALLRQIYSAMILATWFKKSLKESVFARAYADRTKVKGIELNDREMKEKIYRQYLEAFKTGVYSLIREDYDPYTQTTIPRKYFSGGFSLGRPAATSPLGEGQNSGFVSFQGILKAIRSLNELPAKVRERFRRFPGNGQADKVSVQLKTSPQPADSFKRGFAGAQPSAASPLTVNDIARKYGIAAMRIKGANNVKLPLNNNIPIEGIDRLIVPTGDHTIVIPLQSRLYVVAPANWKGVFKEDIYNLDEKYAGIAEGLTDPSETENKNGQPLEALRGVIHVPGLRLFPDGFSARNFLDNNHLSDRAILKLDAKQLFESGELTILDKNDWIVYWGWVIPSNAVVESIREIQSGENNPKKGSEIIDWEKVRAAAPSAEKKKFQENVKRILNPFSYFQLAALRAQFFADRSSGRSGDTAGKKTAEGLFNYLKQGLGGEDIAAESSRRDIQEAIGELQNELEKNQQKKAIRNLLNSVLNLEQLRVLSRFFEDNTESILSLDEQRKRNHILKIAGKMIGTTSFHGIKSWEPDLISMIQSVIEFKEFENANGQMPTDQAVSTTSSTSSPMTEEDNPVLQFVLGPDKRRARQISEGIKDVINTLDDNRRDDLSRWKEDQVVAYVQKIIDQGRRQGSDEEWGLLALVYGDRPLSAFELAIHPTRGLIDAWQILPKISSVEGLDDDAKLEIMERVYLLRRFLYVMAARLAGDGIQLIKGQNSDLDFYLNQLETHQDLKGTTETPDSKQAIVDRLLSIGDLLVDPETGSVTNANNMKSLQGLVAIINKLGKNKQWKRIVNGETNQTKIQRLKRLSASKVPRRVTWRDSFAGFSMKYTGTKMFVQAISQGGGDVIESYMKLMRMSSEGSSVVQRLFKIFVKTSAKQDVLETLRAGKREGLFELVEMDDQAGYASLARDLNINIRDVEAIFSQMQEQGMVIVSRSSGIDLQSVLSKKRDDPGFQKKVGRMLGETLGQLHRRAIFVNGSQVNQFQLIANQRVVRNPQSTLRALRNEIPSRAKTIGWSEFQQLKQELQENGYNEARDAFTEAYRKTVDTASSPMETDPLGGIDMNPAQMDLKVGREKDAASLLNIPFPAPDAAAILNADGFVPVIIQITPVPNFPFLLGINEESPENQLELAGRSRE